MSALVIAAVLWIGLHIGVAGTTLRDALVRAVGEKGFRGLFSLASLAVFIFLIYSYNHAPRSVLWLAPDWLRWILVALMLPASFFLLASLTTISANPADAGTKRGAPRGILRVTRHPMMWSFAIWGGVHLIGRGELAASVFFGAFLLTALAGMPSIDHKFARRAPQVWSKFAAETSILPGGAIAAGRNRLVLAEFGWLLPLLAVGLWLVLLFAHQKVMGVAPVPLP